MCDGVSHSLQVRTVLAQDWISDFSFLLITFPLAFQAWFCFRYFAALVPIHIFGFRAVPYVRVCSHVHIVSIQLDMLFRGIQLQPYTVIFILFGSDFGVLGHMSRVVWLSLSDVRVAKVRFAVDVEAHAVTIATPTKQDKHSPLNCESWTLTPNRINIHHSIVNPEPSHKLMAEPEWC